MRFAFIFCEDNEGFYLSCLPQPQLLIPSGPGYFQKPNALEDFEEKAALALELLSQGTHDII